MHFKIELCSASVEAIRLARRFDIDRIELCQNLEQGGLTPSAGLVKFAVDKGIETHVLIRPRAGGFFYHSDEFEVMLDEVKTLQELSVSGIVVGALSDHFLPDIKNLNEIIKAAEGLDLTFHRAFDEVVDWKKSLDLLIGAGFKRVLSSGLASNVEIGMYNLAKMKQFVGNSIEIMPGGGVNLSNIHRIIEEVKPDAIHFSGTVKTLLDEESLFSETILKVDEKKIEKLVQGLKKEA